MGGKEPYRNSDATCQVKSLIDAKDSKRIRATPLHHAFKTIDKRMGSGQTSQANAIDSPENTQTEKGSMQREYSAQWMTRSLTLPRFPFATRFVCA